MTVNAKTERFREVNPKALRKGGAEVGVWAGQAAGDGKASLVEIAVWNEFGTKRKDTEGSEKTHIPERPFMRHTTTVKKDEWSVLVARANRLVLAGKLDAGTASEIVGQQIQADIQDVIIDWTTPGNADSTIKAKGKDDPLYNKGELKDGIKYEVKS